MQLQKVGLLNNKKQKFWQLFLRDRNNEALTELIFGTATTTTES